MRDEQSNKKNSWKSSNEQDDRLWFYHCYVVHKVVLMRDDTNQNDAQIYLTRYEFAWGFVRLKWVMSLIFFQEQKGMKSLETSS